jgi:hypothetical protein
MGHEFASINIAPETQTGIANSVWQWRNPAWTMQPQSLFAGAGT